MKKCRQCAKPATLHITEIRDGEVHALHLCESCAQDYLNQSDNGGAPDTSELGKLADVSEQELDALDHLVCPNCGISFREFRAQGRLGCPHDYLAFEDELTPLLENIHGATQHCGKYPKRAPDSSQRQYELIKLRNDLRVAIEEENYEEAAQIRDRIQSMETEMSNEASTGDA